MNKKTRTNKKLIFKRIMKNKTKKKLNQASVKAKQNAFIEAYNKSLGIISHACKRVNITRQLVYEWKKNDTEFAARLEDVKEIKRDFVETSLCELVKEKNPAAVIFAAKCLLKDRGYKETTDIALSGNINLDLPKEEKTLYDKADVEKLEKIKEIINPKNDCAK